MSSSGTPGAKENMATLLVQLADENERLRNACASLTSQLEQRHRHVEQLNRQNAHLASQQRSAAEALEAEKRKASDLHRTQAELARAREELAQTQIQLQSTLHQFRKMVAETHQAAARSSDPSLLAENARLQATCTSLEQDVSRREGEIRTLQQSLQAEAARMRQHEAALVAHRDTLLKQMKAGYEEQIRNLKTQRDTQLKEAQDRIEAFRTAGQHQLNAVSTELNQHRAELKRAREELARVTRSNAEIAEAHRRLEREHLDAVKRHRSELEEAVTDAEAKIAQLEERLRGQIRERLELQATLHRQETDRSARKVAVRSPGGSISIAENSKLRKAAENLASLQLSLERERVQALQDEKRIRQHPDAGEQSPTFAEPIPANAEGPI